MISFLKKKPLFPKAMGLGTLFSVLLVLLLVLYWKTIQLRKINDIVSSHQKKKKPVALPNN